MAVLFILQLYICKIKENKLCEFGRGIFTSRAINERDILVEFKFKHFLNETKNPCFYVRYEKDLFEGLLNTTSLSYLNGNTSSSPNLSPIKALTDGNTTYEYLR